MYADFFEKIATFHVLPLKVENSDWWDIIKDNYSLDLRKDPQNSDEFRSHWY